MLSWWLSRPTEGNRVQDEDSHPEPPETPAPVFAARALKSAFFGTPGQPGDDTAIEVKTKTETMVDKDTRTSQYPNASPTKPPGILLTPGTATARRKTVSFGSEVADKNETIAEGETAIIDKQVSSPPKLQSYHKATRRTPLMKSLERAREVKARKSDLERNRSSSSSQQQPLIDLGQDINSFGEAAATWRSTTKPSTSHARNHELLQELVSRDEIDGDMTMDLNEPHSQSGKYWKSVFDRYHTEATTEMEKLVKFKHLAKSYAQKKDAEKIELTEKLKEEQHRVLAMEDRISKLSAEITTTGSEGSKDESSELVKELARQKALALQYKTQVEEFRVALDGNTAQSTVSGVNGVLPLRTEETLTDTRRELRIAQEQPNGSASLSQEMRDLRKVLSSTERTNSKLQAENAELKQELLKVDLRLEEQKEKYEKRCQETEEQLQKKIDAYKNLQQDYNTFKEKMKARRVDFENILREKHEQAVQLRKELASMRRAGNAIKVIQDPLEKSREEERVVARSQKPPAQIEENLERRLVEGADIVREDSAQEQKKPDQRKHSSHLTNTTKSRDNLLPVLSPSTSDPPRRQAYWKHTDLEAPRASPTMKVQQSALSEIVNNANLERPFERTGPVARTPLTHRITNMLDEIPGMELPSPEPSVSYITNHKVHEGQFQPSPRPSMFTFTSSPPKADRWRTRTPKDLPMQRPAGNPVREREVHVASTRLPYLDGSRTRSTLPPDRAAAARARVEQKMAEKKRLQRMRAEKENIPN